MKPIALFLLLYLAYWTGQKLAVLEYEREVEPVEFRGKVEDMPQRIENPEAETIWI